MQTDGGKTWIHGQHYGDGINIDANGTDWIPGNAIHWAGSLEINPFDNKQAWVTSGNGIFMTDDITAPRRRFECLYRASHLSDGEILTAVNDESVRVRLSREGDDRTSPCHVEFLWKRATWSSSPIPTPP